VVRIHPLIVTLTGLTLCAGPVRAQSCSDIANIWQFLEQCAGSVTSGEPSTLKGALEQAYDKLRDPATLNSALGVVDGELPGGRVLRDLNLHFVNVEEGENQELGLRYDWSRSLVRTPHHQGTAHWGYDVVLSSQGLLTANADENPEELLESKAYPSFFWSWGGAVDSATVVGHLSAVQDSIFAYEGFDRDDTGDLEGLMAKIWDGLSTEVYLTVGPEARFEANQTFEEKQWAVGGKVGFDIKAWKTSSALAKLNVFDWPAALLRYLSGMEGGIHPRGSSIPTVLLSLHRVSPDANPQRETLEGLDAYSRWSVEVNYRSQVAQAGGGPVWLEMSYRHHEENDPSQAIRNADLHAYDRFKLGLFGPGGLAVWWATGRLPLDREEADHYGIGLRLRF
jgi:hypothetical protein